LPAHSDWLIACKLIIEHGTMHVLVALVIFYSNETVSLIEMIF